MSNWNAIATWGGAEWLAMWIDMAWRGAVLLGLAALFARALRDASASTRHLVWSVAVVALVALPVLSWTLPSWRAPLPEAVRGALASLQSFAPESQLVVPQDATQAREATGTTARVLPASVESEPVTRATPENRSASEARTQNDAAASEAASGVQSGPVDPRRLGDENAGAPTADAATSTLFAVQNANGPIQASQSVEPTQSTQLPQSTQSAQPAQQEQPAQAAQSTQRTQATQPTQAPAVPWFAWVLPLWALGTVLVGSWFALQHGSVRYLGSRAKPEGDPDVLRRVERARKQIGLERSVHVLRGSDADMPMTWGFSKAVLLLPRSMPAWPEARQRDVLLHELAHIKRFDHWTQLAAQIACALHWFNPLTWYAARRMLQEREHACDDFVLNTGARPSDYAQHLLDVARSMRTRRVGAAAIAMAGRATLPDRLRAVLEPRRSRRGTGWWASATVFALALLFVVPLAAVDLERDAPRVERMRIMAPRVEWQHLVPPRTIRLPERVVLPGHSITVRLPELAVVPWEAPGDELLLAPPVLSVEPLPDSDPLVFAAPRVEARIVAPSRPLVSSSSVAAPRAPVRRHSASVVEVGDGGTVTQVNTSKGRWNISWSDGDDRLRIRARGEIELSRDMTDIVSISHRGYVDIEEERGRDKRRVKLRGESDGTITRQWWVDGDERPYDDEARAWLAETLPEMTRRAGFAVDKRVASLLVDGGVEAVLEEIEEIDSDHVVRLYFTELTGQADLDAEQLERILEHAGETIGSDFELAELLINGLQEATLRPEGTLVYARATHSIGSDYEQSRALRVLVERYDLDEVALEAVLEAARDIGSDFELARLLIEVGREQVLTPALHRPFFETMRSIGSDFEHRRVLMDFVERDDLADDLVADILTNAGQSIGSDYELAELLVALCKHQDVKPAWVPSYVEALGTIGSDYEFRRAAEPLVREGKLDDASLILLLEAAEKNLGSDFEMAQLLVHVARTHTLSDETREAFLRASDTIGSNHENRRVLSELVRSER